MNKMRRAVSKILPTPKLFNNETSNPFSNFGSNFRIDFHAIDDFYVQLDKPHQIWLPGDEVPGQIVLISKKNLANIVITLSLIGYIKINASSHSKLRPIRHTLFDHTITIYGDDNNNTDEFSNGLLKGEHVFPFIVKLPNKRIFTSIDFGKGSINYVLKASIGSASSYASQPSSPINSLASPTTTPAQSPSETSDTTTSSMSSISVDRNVAKKNFKILQNSTYTSEKLINLVNPIDVSTLSRPKPKRLILKDPRSTGKRLSRTQSSTSTINTVNTCSTFSSNNSDQMSVTDSQHQQQHSPQQPQQLQHQQQVQQTLTQPQHTLNSNPNGFIDSHQHSIHSHHPQSSQGSSLTLTRPPAINVILEVPQRGYLRGELIPIKLSINHLKKIQDLNGIIITFVRVCRLDNGADGVVESFRKDLQQSVLPLYVDPVTFQSEINTNIRVPADAFPTIVGCPLVSFQYFIDVLINLSGKSVGLDSDAGDTHSPDSASVATAVAANKVNPIAENFNGGTTPEPYKFNFNFHNSNTLTSLHHQKERSGFINTDRFKRSKKFLQLTTEIVIGTHRSPVDESIKLPREQLLQGENSRRSSSSNSITSPPGQGVFPGSPASTSQVILTEGTSDSPISAPNLPINPHPHPPNIPSHLSQARTPYINPIPESAEINSFQTPPYFESNENILPPPPPPTAPNYDQPTNSNFISMLQSHSELSEKDRMRAHESGLLPSAPPIDDASIAQDQIQGINQEQIPNNQGNNPVHIQSDQLLESGSQNLQSSNQLNFFTYDSTNITQERTIDTHNTGDDLYQVPGENGEYVPNYMSSKDDRLLVSGSNCGGDPVSTGTNNSRDVSER
ncbi:RIM8 [[Candida] subhashii]|uniref:pH-response regulator protein palF/RIM8 n=1 Tax=[Candida] subhashii TaxID=561895 RepID=A0A8J5QIJ7_9ASCO|nr:RIM8 [[Candida] subhashii]KAG7662604.1 RIM8 [[Candida] subhashii]